MADYSNRELRRKRASQPWFPQSGIEQSQGNPYPRGIPGSKIIREQTQKVLDPGVEIKKWRNPYKQQNYPLVLDTANIPVQAIPGNYVRAYLVIQNKGPGNLWFSIGQDASVLNGFQLVQTQIYEYIGGGSVHPDGTPYATAFVPRDYVSVLTDTAGTIVTVSEGIWVYTPN